jgi:uncharacterized protein YjiS (DUF1127 family)
MAQVISNFGSSRVQHGRTTSYLGEVAIGLFNRVQDWSERRRTRNHLYQMPDYILQDIGVSRSEVETEWQKPFWKA